MKTNGLGKKIKRIVAADEENYVVTVDYTHEKNVELDLSPMFVQPKNLTKEILVGGIFSKCFVENGALGWPNGLELCPDAVYEKYRVRSSGRKKPAA